MFVPFLDVEILNLDMLNIFVLTALKNLLFLLLVNLNFVPLVVLYMLKNGRIAYMNNFLMFSIYISLFLFLLVLSGISSFFSNLNFVNLLMLHILLSNILFKKIGIHQVGAIINIHTFARDTSWNPHIHAIVTHGGLDINNNWKTPKSFPWTVFRKSWQKCSLDILSIHAKETKNINLKNKISLAYKKYQNGFYVNSENFVNNIENIAKYLGKVLAKNLLLLIIELLVLIMILLNFGFKHLILIKRIF